MHSIHKKACLVDASASANVAPWVGAVLTVNDGHRGFVMAAAAGATGHGEIDSANGGSNDKDEKQYGDHAGFLLSL